jgi:CRISPR system Cascade subunit CasC
MVQIHMLVSYPATLLNRDDTGLAKRIPFGGVTRLRISSQCLKKHWRDSPLVTDLGDIAYRSTRIYEQLVADHLVGSGTDPSTAALIAGFLLGETIDTQPVKDKQGRLVRTGQVVVLTPAEVGFLQDLGEKIHKVVQDHGEAVSQVSDIKKIFKLDKDIKKIISELPAAIDTAMFGRMVTSDKFARVDAGVSVAHAFTTHEEAAEIDYFTAVDMLNVDDSGAGLVQDAELTTGVYYIYVVVDMNQLVANLGAHADLASPLAANLVRAAATVTPGAKQGSTAPYTYAEFVMLERGPEQPRTLANAFLQPVGGGDGGPMMESIDALLRHRSAFVDMYGNKAPQTAVCSIHELPAGAPSQASLEEALGQIFQATEA